MYIVKSSFNLYKEEFRKIWILNGTITFPILIIYYIVSAFYQNYFFINYIPLAGDLTSYSLLLIGLWIVQIPFIQLAKTEGASNLNNLYKMFFGKLIPVYFAAVLYAFLVIVGTILLIIPGLILLVLFSFVPYALLIEQCSWKQSFIRSFQVCKQRFFPLLGILFILGLIEYLVELIALLTSNLLTTNYMVLALIQAVINMFFVPYGAILMSKVYGEWTGIYDWDSIEIG
ncbi:hypothetical protein C8P63_12078 [Melghirimyces profundicolus]|uniref:Uncharacterized protein n=1 Tax=Melghirimyces profundicolus TaxID=1242148 RepID=A0A2T6BGV4_9BACL|nr:hypothetical protein [Melghirimyces profundicolus]PTX55281.1 hypothetical protein C8P63_12078 [Melghirimyces profundicolus]